MKAGYLLLVIAAATSVSVAIPEDYVKDDIWKYLDVTEPDTWYFDLLPLPTSNCLYLVFGIKGTQDAIITLSPTNGIIDDVYQVVFGAEGNLFCCIVRGHGTVPVVDHVYLDMLNGTWQYFWLKFEHGILSVGHYGEDYPFVEYYDHYPFKVGYVGVSSHGAVSSWKFFLPGYGNYHYHQNIGEDGGDYFHFPDLPSCNCKWYFEFCVRAGAPVILTLSPEDKIVNNVYQMAIGMEDNLFTCIIKYNGTKPVVDVVTLDILSIDYNVYSWVSFEYDTLSIGYFGHSEPFASYTDLEPLTVSHIGVSSPGPSYWTLFLPCYYDPELIHVEDPGDYYFHLPALPYPQDCFYLKFAVFAYADAVITFSPINGIHNNIYEVILGAEGNLFCCIRKGRGTKPVVDVVHIDMLENCWQYFWIRYSYGRLEIGEEGNEIPIAVYVDVDPLDVKYVGVTSLGYPSWWKFHTHGFGRREFDYHVPKAIPFNFVFPKLHGHETYFEFGVKAESDAVLTFSPKNGPTKNIYQIIVAAEGGLFNCIVRGKGTKPIVDVFSAFELSTCEFTYFWVRISYGLLEIGTYGCYEPFATFADPDPWEVYYLSVGSLAGESWWKIYFPCTDSHYVCNGQELHLQCGQGEINIERAFYGRENLVYCNGEGYDCHSDSAINSYEFCGDVFVSSKFVTKQCQGEESCVIEANDYTFGDACGDDSEYLEVEYSCVGDETVVACEDEYLELECRYGYINVLEAFYGRVEGDLCPSGDAYTKDCEFEDSLWIVRENCQGREDCKLSVGAYIFGEDPCPDVSKYLQVTYTCDAEPYGLTIRPLPFVETKYTIDTPGEIHFLDDYFQHRCIYLVFGVKAKSDAVITLSPSHGVEKNIYEVMLGVEENLFVCIRKYKDTKPVVDIIYLDILEDVWQFFWISFCDGHLAVGHYGYNTPIAAYLDDDPFDVSYVGFTSYHYGSQWIFYLEYIGTYIFECNYRTRPHYPDVYLHADSGYSFEFIIRGNQDAWLWLTPRPYAEYEDSLVIHIGAYGNTYSYIKYHGEILDHTYGALLHGEHDRLFKIVFEDGVLTLYSSYGNVILYASGIAAEDVNYLGFHSSEGITYWWFYDLYFPFKDGPKPLTWLGYSFTRSYGCSSDISLDCGDEYIYIYDSVYGRENNRICRHDSVAQSDGCYTHHLLDHVREQCHNKHSCTYDASSLLSYCYEAHKYFHWTYLCVGQVIESRIIDTYPSSQPDPPSDRPYVEYSSSGSDEYDWSLPQLQEDSYFFYFCVKASDYVTIVLSPVHGEHDDIIIIVISRWYTSITVGGETTKRGGSDLLSDYDYRCFWVAFNYHGVFIGKEGEDSSLFLNGVVLDNYTSVVQFVGFASYGDAYWYFYTGALGEYCYQSDREQIYYPALANLPQRRFRFYFGIRAEGEAVLKIVPDDYDYSSYYLTVYIGSYANTKIVLAYGDWSVEVVEDSCLSKATVRYFCLELVDGCIRLLDSDGNLILEGSGVVDYRYLRRIGFYNDGYVGYWYIRGIPYRVPGYYLPPPWIEKTTTTTTATEPPTTTREPPTTPTEPPTTPTEPPTTPTEPPTTPTEPPTTPTEPPTTPTEPPTTPTEPPTTPTEPPTTPTEPPTTPTEPPTTPTEPPTTPTEPPTTPTEPPTTPTEPPTTPTEPPTTPTEPPTTPTEPPTTPTEPPTTPTEPPTTPTEPPYTPTEPPTTPTEPPTTPTEPPTTPTEPPITTTEPPTTTAEPPTTPEPCATKPGDISLHTDGYASLLFQLPELEYETFDLQFRIKSEGCSHLVLSTDNVYYPESVYEIGLGCDGTNYIRDPVSGDFACSYDDGFVTDGEEHSVRIIFKLGILLIIFDDAHVPQLTAFFPTPLRIRHVGVASYGAECWWYFPSEGFGAMTHGIEEYYTVFVPVVHPQFTIPFEVHACSDVHLYLLRESAIDPLLDTDVDIRLGHQDGSITYGGTTEEYEGSLLDPVGVAKFTLSLSNGQLRLVDDYDAVIFEILGVPTKFGYIGMGNSYKDSYWYLYWCSLDPGNEETTTPLLTTTPPPATEPPVECYEGWILHERHCYLIEHAYNPLFADAAGICSSDCATLFEPNSEEEDLFIREQVWELSTGEPYDFTDVYAQYTGDIITYFLGAYHDDDDRYVFSDGHYWSAADGTVGHWNVTIGAYDADKCFAVVLGEQEWSFVKCDLFSIDYLVCEYDPAVSC